MYNFDDIRPYNDSEFKEAYYRLMESPGFVDAMAKCVPGYTLDDLRRDLTSFNTVNEAQAGFIMRWVSTFISQFTSECAMRGMENIAPNQACLFISNHRDITFDPAVLQFYCYKEHRPTTRICIGNNLIDNPTLLDVGRINKMILVIRSGSLREKLANSQRLAAYIQHSLFEEKESVWIAQRDGRTKDGNDYTKQGLLKMVSMGNEKDLIDTLKKMNIVPMSISYEFEPCDQLKAREMAIRENGEPYEKRPGEDFQSIKQGIFDQKGRMTLALGKPLHEELDEVPASLNYNDKLYYVCKLIDKQIYENYQLYPNNYVAHDLMYGDNRFAHMYSEKEKLRFEEHLQRKAIVQDVPRKKMTDYLLRIYATPVDNHFANL